MINEQEVKDSVNLWIEVMQDGDKDKILSLYALQSVFWGTVANKLATDPSNMQAYFVDFLAEKYNLDITLTSCEVQTEDSIGIASGEYSFKFDKNDDVTQVLPARYNFVFKKYKDGTIRIINHHSSQMPDKA